MKFYQSSLLALCSICSTAIAQTQYADVLLTQLQPTAEDAIWSRTKETTPLYPVELARNGIVGCVVFRLDLDQQGKNQKIELVSSVPAKVLNKHATKLIKNWKWHNTSGKVDKAEQKLIRLDFCMGGNSVSEAHARCAMQAKLECSE